MFIFSFIFKSLCMVWKQQRKHKVWSLQIRTAIDDKQSRRSWSKSMWKLGFVVIVHRWLLSVFTLEIHLMFSPSFSNNYWLSSWTVRNCTSHLSIHLIFPTMLWNAICYFPHCVGTEPGAWSVWWHSEWVDGLAFWPPCLYSCISLCCLSEMALCGHGSIDMEEVRVSYW